MGWIRYLIIHCPDSRTVLPLGMSNIVDDGTVTTCKLQYFQQDCIWKLACTRPDLDSYMIIFLVRLNLLNFIIWSI